MATIRRLTILLATSLIVLSTGVTSASAQSAPSFEVVSQDWLTSNDGEFSVDLKIDAPLNEYEVDITVFGASEAPFDTPTEPIHRINGASLLPNEDDPSILTWTMQTRSFGSDENPEALLIPGEGAFPIEFDLRTETDVVASATALMLVVAENLDPNVSLVLAPSVDQLEGTFNLVTETDQVIYVALDGFAMAELAKNPELLALAQSAIGDSGAISYNNTEVSLDSVNSNTVRSYIDQLNRQGQWLNSKQIPLVENVTLYTQQLGLEAATSLEEANYSIVLAQSNSSLFENSLPLGGHSISLPDTSALPNYGNPVIDSRYLLASFELDSDRNRVGLIRVSSDQDLAKATQVVTNSGIGFTSLNQVDFTEAPQLDEAQEVSVLETTQAETKASLFVASHFSLGDGVAADNLGYGAELVALLGQGSSELELQTLANKVELDLTQTSVVAGQALNVASTDAVIPITIVNSSENPRVVRLEIDSDKATITEPFKELAVEPGTNQVDVQVQLRSLGNSGLDVTLLTPDSLIVLSEDQLTLRSTAFPGMGLLLSLGALASLLIWWAVTARRKLKEEPEDHIDLTMSAKSSHAL